jgi:hypothetical protein
MLTRREENEKRGETGKSEIDTEQSDSSEIGKLSAHSSPYLIGYGVL